MTVDSYTGTEAPHSTGQTENTPQIFYPRNKEVLLDWVARGTDGELYFVPAEPGGWLRRTRYNGGEEELSRLPTERANTVAWYVYGDVGSITIA